MYTVSFMNAPVNYIISFDATIIFQTLLQVDRTVGLQNNFHEILKMWKWPTQIIHLV